MNVQLSRRDWLAVSAAALGSLSLSTQRPVRGENSETGKLVVHSQHPLNAEPPLERLVAAPQTPTDQFYVRNHGSLPTVEAKTFRVRVEGLVAKPQHFSLTQLQDKFKAHTASATLTCAGNRRREMSAIKPVGGVQWDAGAIGNAEWSGPALAEILKAVEVQPAARHVWFEGLDSIKEKDGSVGAFGGSIPIARALDAARPALLAHQMNGRPLTAEHGFPLRSLVPGFIGARSVKWLAKIVVSDRPSPNHYLAEAYKLVTSESKDELAKADPIYEFPINAAICTPAAGTKLKAGEVTVGGYALPPGDGQSTIAKVEFSADGGRTWKDAKLAGQSAANCWQLWAAKVALPAGRHELVVRATDSRGQVQNEKCAWNLKGYLYNAWHRCAVEAA